jgi:hypothetical protein
MNGWASFFGELLWWVPWRNPLGRARRHEQLSQQRLRIALERERQFQRNNTPNPPKK